MDILLTQIGAWPVFRCLNGPLLYHIVDGYLGGMRSQHHTAFSKFAFKGVTHRVIRFSVQFFYKFFLVFLALCFSFIINFELDQLIDGHCGSFLSIRPFSLLCDDFFDALLFSFFNTHV